MQSFEIKLPYRDRDDPTWEIIDAAHEVLSGDEQAVAEQIAGDALKRGVTRVGALLDEIEGLDDAGRRQLADEAREACGLTSFSEMEHNAEQAKTERMTPKAPTMRPRRDASGRSYQVCAHEDCGVVPLLGGFPTSTDATKWWCEQHEHLAAPGDLEPYRQQVMLDAFGNPAPMQEVQDFEARYYEKLLADEKAKHERQREESERLAALREQYRETVEPLAIWGYKVDQQGNLDR